MSTITLKCYSNGELETSTGNYHIGNRDTDFVYVITGVNMGSGAYTKAT
jgi:hypothetical protein